MVGRVNLAVIDEAHCALRDRGFRFCYARIGEILDKIRPTIRFACTATLPVKDRAELVRVLKLDHPVEIILPMARANITLHIRERHRGTITNILNEHEGACGIIFTATIAAAKKLYAMLDAQNRSVVLYYGKGMPAKVKKAAQEAFMSGEKRIAVATDSLQLGIDKSDLRFVINYDHVNSIEAWCQAFGRCGRDGRPAFAYGCFRGSTEGKDSRMFLINAQYPPVSDLRDVWDYLISAPFRDETQKEISERVLGGRGRYSSTITVLQRFHLADAKPHPEDGRRKLYRGIGHFDRVDWSGYMAEYKEACARFDKLCALAQLPEHEIPSAIDAYFGMTESAAEHVGAA